MESSFSNPALTFGIGTEFIVRNLNLGVRYMYSNPPHYESIDFGNPTFKLPASLFQ